MAGRKRWQLAQWFELRWWQRYLKGKDKTAYLNWKKGYWHKVVQQAEALAGAPLLVERPLQILDAGCGPAGIFTILEGHRVDAFDPLLHRYQTHLTFFDVTDYPWVQFENQALEVFQPEVTYDLIFCMNAINHVRDIQVSLKNLAAAAKPGAIVVLTVDVHRIPFLKPLFRLLPGDVLHPQQHSLNDYYRLLPEAGLEVTGEALVRHEGLFDHKLLVGRKPTGNGNG